MLIVCEREIHVSYAEHPIGQWCARTKLAGSVLLVDHSYFLRLMRSMRDTNREFTTARTECSYPCRGGATIAKLVANGLFVKLAKHRLRRVIFGVDRDKCWADAAELAGDLIHLGRPCMAEFGV